ncbi:MAG: cytochrome c [Nitrospirales bacterium]
MSDRNRFSVGLQPGGIALIGLLVFFFMPGVGVNGQDPANEKGKGLYQRLCTACHGKAGKGDGYALFDPPPADLKAPATQKKTDDELLDTIRNGHANTAMGTWKYALSDEEMRSILGYVRTLGQKEESR